MTITVRIPSPDAVARVAGITKPTRGRVEYNTVCVRCGGLGGSAAWPDWTCYECGGARRANYSHAEWLFPTDWDDARVAGFLAAKEAAKAARRAEEHRKVVDAAEAARSRQSDAFKAVWARFLAGEFDGDARYGFAWSVLSQTQVLKPITDKQAEAVVAAVAREDARAAEREAGKARSAHVGEVGGKVTVTGKVLCAKTVESRYGTSVLVVIETDGGDKVTTFSTAGWASKVYDGDTVTVTGTVKDHEVYGGEKRTVLTRTKCAEYDAAQARRCARATGFHIVAPPDAEEYL